jgi:hypothetical protein
MDTKNVSLVICLTLFIVVGINAAIYALLYKGDAFRQINLIRHATLKMKSPWENENKALSELADRVEKLKEDRDGENEQT